MSFLEASGDLSISSGVKITIEGSDDLENWTDMMGAFQVTAYPSVPGSEYLPTST